MSQPKVGDYVVDYESCNSICKIIKVYEKTRDKNTLDCYVAMSLLHNRRRYLRWTEKLKLIKGRKNIAKAKHLEEMYSLSEM